MMGTIRRVTRNVKRWRDAGMALRWVAAGMIEANKGFRRLKAHKQLSVLRAALMACAANFAEAKLTKMLAPENFSLTSSESIVGALVSYVTSATILPTASPRPSFKPLI